MTLYAKPLVVPAWAQSAGSTDLVEPANSFVQAGWLSSATPPARQYFNWVLNYATTGVRYLMQNGIALYDPSESYPTYGICQDSSGILYQSLIANNVGNTPSTTIGTAWELLPYVTIASLPGRLSGYVTQVNLTAQLGQYVLSSVLASELTSYVTNTSLSSTLANYVTQTALTSDLTAYVLTSAMAGYLAPKANLASPALTGTPTAPTPITSDNTSNIATTAFVKNVLAGSSAALFAASGYFIDEVTGFKVNWGTIAGVTGSATGGPVSFASPFATACYGVVIGCNGGNVLFNVTSYGNSSFNWQTYGSAATANVMWFAYGH